MFPPFCEEAKQILNQRHMERLQELTEILKEMALAGVLCVACVMQHLYAIIQAKKSQEENSIFV